MSVRIPLPVGTKVRFEFGYDTFTGKIEKYFLPGYQLKNTDTKDMRYAIRDSRDNSHSWIITENMLIDPDPWRLYFDKDYRNQKCTELKLFKFIIR